jgi:hypothetical protein
MKMMPQYLARFAELYARQGRRVQIADDKLWVKYGKMILPVGPIHLNYSLSDDQAHRLMKKFPGALLVRHSDGSLRQSSGEDWYAVICDNFKDLGSFPHESRRQIKRGLENCEVRQVDASFIAEYGYEVYASAFSKYQGVIKPIGRNDYTKLISTTKDFDDIYHYWAGVYNNKVIAYSTVAIYGNEEANISVFKAMPDHLKYYPSNALFYSMNKHYLLDHSMHYINAGFRNIYHKTNMHEFLLKRLSFKKVSLNLCITYNNLLLCFLKLTYQFSGVLGKCSSDLKAIYTLEEIRKKCEPAVKGR